MLYAKTTMTILIMGKQRLPSCLAVHFEGSVFSPAPDLAAFGGVCMLLEDGCNFAGATFINIFVV